MKLKIKRLHQDAVIPSYAKPGDNGLDLTAVSISFSGPYTEYDTGIAIEFEPGYVGLVFPRSSISNTSQSLANSVGVVDQSYRGTIKLRFRTDSQSPYAKTYAKGDRIGQLVIVPAPVMEIEEVLNLGDSERGVGAFGSTGK